MAKNAESVDQPPKVAKPPHPDPDAYTIEEFCRRHSICRATYYNMKEAHTGPREGHAMGRVLITRESAAAWRKKISE
jgi:hypothetical protein